MVQSLPVVVGVDDSPTSDLALRWAIEHARASGAMLRLVCAYRWAVIRPWETPFAELHAPELKHLRAEADELLAGAHKLAVTVAPDLAIESAATEGDPVSVLLDESSHASVLVLGSRQLNPFGSVVLNSVAASVTARSRCPVVVLRAPAGEPAEDPAVVVGVDGTQDSQTVLAFGFDYASRHRLPLKAILCWKGRRLPAGLGLHPESSAERAQSWLSEALAGWRPNYPEVPVSSAVIQDDPAPVLVAQSLEHSLLVVGTRTKHALAGTLLGSVSLAVLHHAICPVALVPTHTG